jgi:hypothetical protein
MLLEGGFFATVPLMLDKSWFFSNAPASPWIGRGRIGLTNEPMINEAGKRQVKIVAILARTS